MHFSIQFLAQFPVWFLHNHVSLSVNSTHQVWNAVNNFKKINQEKRSFERHGKAVIFMKVGGEIEIQYTLILNEGKVNLIRHTELAQEAAIMNAWEKIQEQMTSNGKPDDIKCNKKWGSHNKLSFILMLTELFVLILEKKDNQNDESSSTYSACSLANLWFSN